MVVTAKSSEGMTCSATCPRSGRQRRVQRRQAQRTAPDEFDLLSARAKQEHGAELLIGAATEDELVAVMLDHRLDGHA